MKCILCSAEIEEGMTECPRCGSSFNIPNNNVDNPPAVETMPDQVVTPVEPVAPVAPVDTVQPTVPVEPVTPAEPVAPVNPVEVNAVVPPVNNTPVPPQTPIMPTQANYDSNMNDNGNNNSSIFPYILIAIVLVGIGAVVYLILSGHNIFGDKVTEDLDSTTTTQINGDTSTTVSTTQGNLVTTTTGIEKTTVTADLNQENLITDIDNYTTTYTITLSADGVSMSIKISGIVDQKNKKDSLKVTTSMSGASATVPAYYDFNTGYIYMEDPNNKGSWVKQKTSDPFNDLKSYINKMNNNKDVTKVDEGHYRIKISKEEMKGMVNQSGIDLSLIKGDPVMDIYTKDGYIIRIETDMSNVIQGISKYKIVQNFSLYNQSGDVVIPQNIIDNAKNY